MKVLKSWLNDYIDIDYSDAELASKLSLSGVEVESYQENIDSNAQVDTQTNKISNSDTVFDLDITPNRGDCLSHIGISREIAALTGKRIRKEPISLIMSNESNNVKVEVHNRQDCTQYLSRVVKDVTIKESPSWLKDRLFACGIKPINNVVDITNYIMIDLGQPLHVFDRDKISKSKIVVRRAKSNEFLTTIDNIARKLSSDILVIADGEKAIAVAGVMGGTNSEVNEKTVDLVIEAAEFNPKIIRQSSKKLKLVTEASYRFERGVDSSGVEYAINKAAKLIKRIAGGYILSGISKSGNKPDQKRIDINPVKINELLGVKLSNDEIFKILKSLGFENSGLTTYVPSWRHDIDAWNDLAEEVGRIYGYDKIKTQLIKSTKVNYEPRYYFSEHLKDILASLGFTEVYNYSFLSEEDSKIAGISKNNLLEIANPVQPENKYLRNSLQPGLIKTIAQNPTFDPIAIFEVGNVFNKNKEIQNLAVAIAGKRSQSLEEVIDKMASELKVSQKLFTIKNWDSSELAKYKVRKPNVRSFEVNIDLIIKNSPIKKYDFKLKGPSKNVIYRPISKYPSVTRDLAFVVDRSTSADKIKNKIYSISNNVNRVELFDEFISDMLGKRKKNLAFHIYLQSMEKTMKDDESDKIINDIINEIERQFKAKLRA